MVLCYRYSDKTVKARFFSRVAFQVRVKPKTYDVGPETVGLGSKCLDPNFKNKELEWATKRRGSIILTGLLVKLESQ